jgi:Protein of unknown function (DUF3540)
MSKVAVLKSERKAPAAARDYLGPAVVVAVDASFLEARLPDGGLVRAALALAFPYRPVPDDVVLVVGREGAHYVIGVLRGSGQTTLAFEGDVRVRAVGGKLALVGDEGVQIEGRELEVLVSAVKIVASSMVQKLTTAYQRVTGLLSVRAGEAETLVEGTTTTRAKNGVILTEDKMVVNGKQIFLG